MTLIILLVNPLQVVLQGFDIPGRQYSWGSLVMIHAESQDSFTSFYIYIYMLYKHKTAHDALANEVPWGGGTCFIGFVQLTD